MLSDAVIVPTSSTSLADFTSPYLIVPRLRGRDAASVIQELSQAMQQDKRVPDLLSFYHAALNRELLVSDWQPGIAFPHVRLSALKRLSFALGRSDEPLCWVRKSVHAIRLVFLIAVPATESTGYFSLISGLARLAKQERLMEELYKAHDNFEIIEVLKQIELRTNPAPDLVKKGGTCPEPDRVTRK